MSSDLHEDERYFFPVYVQESTRVATEDEITTFKKWYQKSIKALLEKTEGFYERMMLSKGVFYTRTETLISFHDVFGMRMKNIPCGVFFAYHPQGGREFGIASDYSLHLHLFSDMQLTDQLKKMNEEESTDVGQALTYFYFEEKTDKLVKVILAPNRISDKRRSLIKKNPVFVLLPSEITREDLGLVRKAILLLQKKMKLSEKSKYLA